MNTKEDQTPPAARPTPITLADEVGAMVHAFSDADRRDRVRALARQVADLERQLAEARESRDHYIAENNRIAEELKLERKQSFREQRDALVEAASEGLTSLDRAIADHSVDEGSRLGLAFRPLRAALAAVKGGADE